MSKASLIVDLFNLGFTAKDLKGNLEAAADGDAQGILNLVNGAASVAQFVPALGTPIISAGLLALNVMNQAAGNGTADSGERFREGANRFGEVRDTLEKAFPTEDWQSTGSTAYTRQNTSQQDRVTTMQATDSDVAAIIAAQAEDVFQLNEFLDFESTMLNTFIYPALAALAIPVYGKAISLGIEIGAVAGTVPPSEIAMAAMAVKAMQNAQKIQQEIGVYTDIAQRAIPTGSTSDFVPAPGEGCTPSGSGGGSGSGSGAGSGGGSQSSPSSPTVPTTPTTPTPEGPLVSVPDGAGLGNSGSGTGSTGGGTGGSPSGGSSAAGGGMMGGAVGGLMGVAGSIVQMATQATAQSQKPQQAPIDANSGATPAADEGAPVTAGAAGREGERAPVDAVRDTPSAQVRV